MPHDSFSELLRILPGLLWFRNGAWPLALYDTGAWTTYVFHLLWSASIWPIVCGLILMLLNRKLKARYANGLARIAWTVVGIEVGLAFLIWLVGFWPITVPIALILGWLWFRA